MTNVAVVDARSQTSATIRAMPRLIYIEHLGYQDEVVRSLLLDLVLVPLSSSVPRRFRV